MVMANAELSQESRDILLDSLMLDGTRLRLNRRRLNVPFDQDLTAKLQTIHNQKVPMLILNGGLVLKGIGIEHYRPTFLTRFG